METHLLLQAQIGFSLITIIYCGFFIRELRKGIDLSGWHHSKRRKIFLTIVSALAAWMIFVAVWSGSGMMRDFSIFPFNLLPVLAIPLITSLAFTLSRAIKVVLAALPPSSLIRLQSFRFFVELLLWLLFAGSLLPIQMTFEGRNFDILAGVTAPLVAWLASRKKVSRGFLVVWNIACLALLLNIVVIAVLSTPSPLRVFMNEPANTVVSFFPISLWPGMLVPLAYTLHFFSLRQLLSRPGKYEGQPTPAAESN